MQEEESRKNCDRPVEEAGQVVLIYYCGCPSVLRYTRRALNARLQPANTNWEMPLALIGRIAGGNLFAYINNSSGSPSWYIHIIN